MATINMPITDLARLNKNDANTALGGFNDTTLVGDNFLEGKNGEVEIALMKVNMPLIPSDSVVQSATLRIRIGEKIVSPPATEDSANIGVGWAYKELVGWNESNVTYQQRLDSFGFRNEIFYETTKDDWNTYDITTQFSEAYNNNKDTFIIKSNTSVVLPNGVTSIQVYGNGAATSIRPTISVTYGPKPSEVPTNLKPSGSLELANEPITLTWDFNSTIAGDAQTGYEIQYSTDGSSYQSVSQDTALQYHIFPADTFGTGQVYWRVRTKNVKNVFSDWSTQVVFLTAAKPSTPVITSGTTTTTSHPVIIWTATDQYIYQIQVLKGSEIYADTGEVISIDKSHRLEVALENSTTFTIKLRIKNQYNVWSDFTTKSLTTNFQVPQIPVVSKVEDLNNGIIKLSITNPADTLTFSKNEVHRRLSNGQWERIADNLSKDSTFIDKTFEFNKWYEYKIRTYATTEGFADSQIIKVKFNNEFSFLHDISSDDFIKLSGFASMVNAEDIGCTMKVIGNTSINFKKITQKSSRQFAGRTKPVTEFGEFSYSTANVSITVPNSHLNYYLDALDLRKIFCLRTHLKKIFCTLDSDPSYAKVDNNNYNISFSLIENDYNEVI